MSASSQLLMVGVQETLLKVIDTQFPEPKKDAVPTSDAFFEKLEGITDGVYSAILIGAEMTDVTALELAQSLRMQTPATKLFFISSSNKTLPPADLIKNGCDDIFFLPMDEKSFRKSLRKALETELSKPVLEGIPIDDLTAGTNVDFEVSVYLPMNKKYVKILKPGDQVRENQLEKMNTQEIGQLYVAEKDIEKFVKYTNETAKIAGGSKYEAQQKFNTSVRGLFQDLISAPQTMNFDEGKKFFQTAQQIVAPYVGKIKNMNFKTEILAGLPEGDFDIYERSAKVSVVAALLSAHLGKSSPENMALAGLFMDLGIVLLPMELQTKAYADMSKEERDLYEKHPLESVRILQERKMVFPSEVLDGINQHHERMDLKGYPKQIQSHKLAISGQMLYLADRIVDLTVVKSGHKNLKATELTDALNNDHGLSRELLLEFKRLI